MSELTLMQKHQALLDRIKAAKPKMLELCAHADREFGAPDLFYRFYYQSYKVYRIQSLTKDFMDLIREVSGDHLDKWFLEIVEPGMGKAFDLSHNEEWLKHTRPMMEAYFHVRMVIDQMLWCADNLEAAESMLSSPWAAVLIVMNLR